MVIKIIDCKINQEGILVSFDSELGSAIAFWNGKKPMLGEVYHVELEISDDMNFGVEVIEKPEIKPKLFVENDKLAFYAQIESIEEDGYTVFRLESNIITAIVNGVSIPINSTVLVKPNKVILYSEDY